MRLLHSNPEQMVQGEHGRIKPRQPRQKNIYVHPHPCLLFPKPSRPTEQNELLQFSRN